jgi:hypothetical protein
MTGYGTDEDFATWASAGGYTVPSGTVAAARQRGSAFVDGEYEARFPGVPTAGATQERAWPRTGAVDRYGNAIASDAIPERVVWASYEAALAELQSAGSLSPQQVDTARVKRRKTDVIEREFFEPGVGASSVPKLPQVERLLLPILKPRNVGVIVV